MTLQNAFANLATESKQEVCNTTLSNINSKTPALESGNVPVVIKNISVDVDTGLDQPLTDTQLRASAIPVSGTFWQATQPVSFARLASGTDSVTIVPSGTQTISGTVTSNIGTTNGIALDTTLTGGTQRTKITDGTNNASVVQIGTQVTSSNYGVATNAVIHGLSTGGGGSYVDVKVTPSGSLVVDATISGTAAISATQLPLPSGAATAANQTTGNTSLNSIDTKTPSLSGGRVPVESNLVQGLTDSQLRASAVPVSFTRLASGTDSVTTVPSGTQVVSGTVTSNIGTTNGLALDATVNSLLKPSSTLNAVGSITNTVVVKADTLVNQTNAFKVDGSAVTQPVSFTRLNSATDSVTTVPSGTQTISGTVTANAGTGTFAVSAASLPLPTGAATSANQTTANTSLNTIATKITQIVDDGVGEVSVGNSTTTPLSSGATFTGTGEQNQFPDVYVSCITDKAGKLYFDFSNDGTNWNVFPPAGFDLVAGVHEAHKALKAGRYFRARVVNTSGSAQTYLRLYTYYGEFEQLTSPLNFAPNNDTDAITTKSVIVGQTAGGVFKFVSASNEGYIETAIKDPTSVFGEVITAELTPIVQADFVYGINANLFSSTVTGSGTANSSNQMGVASTTANTSSSSLIQSVRRAKYRAGEGIIARFTAQFTTGASNSTQTAGMRNADIDGWFIGYNGTSFGIMYRRNSVDTWIAQSSFNLDKLDGTGVSGVNLDPTKLNIFQLSIGYLGARGCVFSILSPITGHWVNFHDYSLHNVASSQTQSVNPTMTFGIQAINTTNNTNMVVRCGSVGVFIVGKRVRIGSTYGLNNFKSISTTETNVLTLRNNTTINSVTNQSQIRIRSLSCATASTVPVVFKLIKNATLGGTPSFTNIDATNSCAAFDVAGTTVTGGNVQFNTLVGTGGNVFVDLTEFDIFLAPNDTLTVSAVAISGAAANQVVAINWNEDI